MYEGKVIGRIMGFRYRLRHIDWLTPTKAAFILLVLGIIVIVGGYVNQYPEGFNPDTAITDFYANLGTELLSIAVTVLVVDALGARREANLEKHRLMREMSSPDNGIALLAVREMRAHGYLGDGSLRHADLMGANLQGAELYSADLCGAALHSANLMRADLLGADLRRAILWNANLRGARLDQADLSGADLIWSNLEGARVTRDQLKMAGRLRGATLPDGSRYDGRFQLQRDISQARTDGVAIDDPEALARWYAMPYDEFVRSLDLRRDRPELTDWECR